MFSGARQYQCTPVFTQRLSILLSVYGNRTNNKPWVANAYRTYDVKTYLSLQKGFLPGVITHIKKQPVFWKHYDDQKGYKVLFRRTYKNTFWEKTNKVISLKAHLLPAPLIFTTPLA